MDTFDKLTDFYSELDELIKLREKWFYIIQTDELKKLLIELKDIIDNLEY